MTGAEGERAAATAAAVLLAGGRASRMGGIDKPGLQVHGRSLLQRALDAVREAGCSPVVVVGPRPGGVGDAGGAGDAAGARDSGGAGAAVGASDSLAAGAAGAADAAGAAGAAAGADRAEPLDARGNAVRWVRENPPFGGPAAAVVTGLEATGVDAEWTFLLACDLPRAQEAVRRLGAWVAAVAHGAERAGDRGLHRGAAGEPAPLGPASLGSGDPTATLRVADGACLVDASGRGQWLTGVYRTSALSRAAASLPDGGRDASVRSLLAGLDIEALTDTDHVADDVDTWDDFSRITKETSHG